MNLREVCEKLPPAKIVRNENMRGWKFAVYVSASDSTPTASAAIYVSPAMFYLLTMETGEAARRLCESIQVKVCRGRGFGTMTTVQFLSDPGMCVSHRRR